MVSIDQLADVEVQLVMHGLELKDILRFARCSQRIVHAAVDSAFAWQHLSPLRVLLPTPAPMLAALQSSHLLRHVSLSVLVLSSDVDCSARGGFWLESQLFSRCFADAARSARLHTLDLSRCTRLGLEAWLSLLAQPCMRSLRVLRARQLDIAGLNRGPDSPYASHARGKVDVWMRALVAALPALHTLRLEQCARDTGEYEWMHLVPKLTQLSVKDIPLRGNDDQHPRGALLLPLRACTQLKEIRIREMAGEVFRPLFTAPNLSGLQSLTLERFICSDPHHGEAFATPDDFIAVYSALVHLRSLELIECSSVDLILAHAHLAPSLRFMTLRPHVGYWTLTVDTGALPSPPRLAEILTRCAQISTFVGGEEKEEAVAGATRSFRRGVERQWKRMTEATELAPFGQRFQMRVQLGKMQLDSSKDKPQHRDCSVQ